MTLTLDLPPAEEAELRRLATAGDLPAVRAKLAGRLDELAAGLARPVGPTKAPPAADVPRTVAGLPVPGADPEFDRRAAEIAAGWPCGFRPEVCLRTSRRTWSRRRTSNSAASQHV